MRSIWIFILISIVANIIGTISKANQKKKPMQSSVKKAKQRDHNYKDQNMMSNIEKNYNTNNGYDDKITQQSMDYGRNEYFSYKAEEKIPANKETPSSEIDEYISEEENFFDIGLPELQQAIVMTEILNKPLAMRK